jgi:hypothetical protein
MYIHPALQVAMILVSLVVLWLGIKRFAARSLGKKARFNWRLHVWLGTIVLVAALLGALGGLIVARGYWSAWLATGPHGVLGLIAVPFIIFGGLTGWYMNQRKKSRRVLPLIHGLNNLVLIGLFAALVISGLVLIEQIKQSAIM